jgi:polygalacturonase
MSRLAIVSCTLLLWMRQAQAQDTRQVEEPALPPACTILTANPTGTDTLRIQAALDHCGAGKAVVPGAQGANWAFRSGPFSLRPKVTLVVERGVTLFASRNPRDYDLAPGSCGVVDQKGHGCRPLIAADHAPGSGVMGEGTIDGQGGERLEGMSNSWWDLAQQAKVENANQNCPRLIVATQSDDFTLYRITLKNSPNFHVSYNQGNGFTAWGVKIDSPKTARNTDGIDPVSSTNVSILYSHIRAGDDNVAIKAGSKGPSSHITVAHNHFYSGHGMSIGSETDGGASAIRVEDLTIDGADNGLRIKSNKSRGGLVENVQYSDVCLRDVKNPILMDTHYSAAPAEGNKIPTFRDIVLEYVRITGGGMITLDGFDAAHPLGIRFNSVQADNVKVRSAHVHAEEGAGAVAFPISGEDVHLHCLSATTPGGLAGCAPAAPDATPAAASCVERFVPFPVGRSH